MVEDIWEGLSDALVFLYGDGSVVLLICGSKYVLALLQPLSVSELASFLPVVLSCVILFSNSGRDFASGLVILLSKGLVGDGNN